VAELRRYVRRISARREHVESRGVAQVVRSPSSHLRLILNLVQDPSSPGIDPLRSDNFSLSPWLALIAQFGFHYAIE
jgi:hypothetical protein